jgi:hypothetical protein
LCTDQCQDGFIELRPLDSASGPDYLASLERVIRHPLTRRTILRNTIGLVLVALALGVPVRSAGADPETDALREAVDALTEEVRRMKEDLAIPVTEEEFESRSGLSPGASRVYTRESGLSLGGYGEFSLEEPTGPGARSADFTRLVTYLGYKFAPDLLVNTEVEVEHATTEANLSDRAGEVALEFAYLDFLPSPSASFRVGQLLLPLGLVNEMHEPPFYRGTARPQTERTIIPSTWRGLGAGLHGETGDLSYRVYVVESLDAAGFGATGIRGGRQQSNGARFEDAGAAGRVEWHRGGVTAGVSGFAGKSGQEREVLDETLDATVTVAAAHAVVRHRALEAKALVAGTSIGDAAAISALVSDAGSPVTIPERQVGGYVELAFEAGRFVGLAADRRIDLWARAEAVDLQREVPVGFTSDPTLERRTLTIGAEFRPHPSVVLKADWTTEDDGAEADSADPLRVGAGFVF